MKPRLAVSVLILSAALARTALHAGVAERNARTSQTETIYSQPSAEGNSVWNPIVQDVARQLDILHDKVEEWGTVTLSSFILAPPVGKELPVVVPARDKDNNPIKDKDGIVFEVLMVPKIDGNGNLVRDKDSNIVKVPLTRRSGTFGFDLQQSAQDYFNLAGAAEGTAQNSLRIFQQFAGSASAQFLPDEAAQYANQRQQFLRQQAVGNEVQNDQLDLYRANLARSQQNQRFLVEAAHVHLDEAQQDVQRAQTRQTLAQQTVESAKTAKPFDQAKLDAANADLSAATAALTTARQARDTAQTNLNSAMTQPIVGPSAPTGLPSPPTSYPTSTGTPVPSGSPWTPSDMTTTLNDIGKSSLVAPLQSSSPATANFPTRARVIDAASNKTVQEILNFIGNPTAADQFRDKTVIFGVTEVALNPGWRTKKDYSIRLDVKTQYEWASSPHAETIRRLVRSNLYPLSVRRVIADSYPAMLQQEDLDFLAQQQDYLSLSKEILAQAEQSVTDAKQQVVLATERLNFTAAAVKAAQDKLNQAKGEAAKVAETELKQALALNADAGGQSALSKLKTAQAELEQARRQSDANGANVEDLDLDDFCQQKLSEDLIDDISVAAVSPLMDTQNLDETSSYARQDDLAIFLAASMSKAGFRGQAQAYERYIKQRRQDIATRSAAAIANSYSFAGGIYGFQIGPRLRALADPAARKSRPAQTLDKQTFPVLILLGVTPDDLRPALTRTGNRVKVWERRLKTDYSYRWVRPQHYFWPPWANKRKDMPTAFFKQWASVQDAFNRRKNEIKAERENSNGVIDQEAKQYEVLNSAFFGAHHEQRIPSYFLVPDRFIAVAQPFPRSASPNPAASLPPDVPPMVSSIIPNLPATGTGIGAEAPIKVPGKISAPVTKEGPAKPATVSASFSVMVKGKQFEGLDTTKIGCVSTSAKLNPQNPPTLIATDLVLVSIDISAKTGDFTLVMPYKTDKEHEALAKFGTQTTAPTLNYFVQD